MNQHIKIGLFGFGCVGQGLCHVLHETRGLRADIIRICIKDREKERSLPASIFTFDPYVLLNDPEINTIVELIDDAGAAYDIVRQALQRGKNVVSANKKMLATHLQELIQLQKSSGAALLYEGAACGSIPIIRNLEEYYDNDLLRSVSGIFNGSTNYILSKTVQENLSYEDALKQAQEKGFAESDPTLDVDAFDPLFKLVLIAGHAFGIISDPRQIFHFGIRTLSAADQRYAQEKGWKIKVVPHAVKSSENSIALWVAPQFTRAGNYLFHVEDEYNAVELRSAFSDKQFLLGKGAGGNPTGSAVLSDIAALRYHYRYEYKKATQQNGLHYNDAYTLQVYYRYSHRAHEKLLRFSSIQEEYHNHDWGYTTGTVTLAELFRAREAILHSGGFIAVLPAH